MSRVNRTIKNAFKWGSPAQILVQEATDNDGGEPTGMQLSEIAQLTYGGSTDFSEIMDMLD